MTTDYLTPDEQRLMLKLEIVKREAELQLLRAELKRVTPKRRLWRR